MEKNIKTDWSLSQECITPCTIAIIRSHIKVIRYTREAYQWLLYGYQYTRILGEISLACPTLSQNVTYTIVNPLYNYIQYNIKNLYSVILHRMALSFKTCILYKSEFSSISKCLRTNATVTKRVHCTCRDEPQNSTKLCLFF